MKRNFKTCLLISGFILLSSCSSNDLVVEHTVNKKVLDVFEDGSVSYKLDCYFLDDIDAPYVKLPDLLNYRMDKQFAKGFPIADYSFNYKNDVLTATNIFQGKEYSIIFDGKNDEIRSDDFQRATDLFDLKCPIDFMAADYSPIIEISDFEVITAPKETVLSLKDYDIDLYPYDDTVLVPLNILNNILFSVGEKVFAYNGKSICETTYVSEGTDAYKYYYDSYAAAEKNQLRNQDTADFNKNEFFFIMNNFFGRMNDTNIGDFRDYAKYLGVYDDISSTEPLRSFYGMFYLVNSIDDLHSAGDYCSPEVGNRYGADKADYAVVKALIKLRYESDGYRYNNFVTTYNSYQANRKSSLGSVINAGFYYYNDTCFIRYDSFARTSNDEVFKDGKVNEEVSYEGNTYTLFYKAFKDLKANHPEVKNIVIDEAINGGGDVTTMVELAGFLNTKTSLVVHNKLTGEIYKTTYKVDTNYDGVYDDKDYQAKGYNVFCLASSASFSCGNFFPLALKDNNSATLIGQNTAGGSCVVEHASTAVGDLYQFSSIYEYGTIDENGKYYSGESGVHPDLGLSSANLFNKDKIIELIE
jgi:hypothetical protein